MLWDRVLCFNEECTSGTRAICQQVAGTAVVCVSMRQRTRYQAGITRVADCWKSEPASLLHIPTYEYAWDFLSTEQPAGVTSPVFATKQKIKQQQQCAYFVSCLLCMSCVFDDFVSPPLFAFFALFRLFSPFFRVFCLFFCPFPSLSPCFFLLLLPFLRLWCFFSCPFFFSAPPAPIS